MWLSHLPIEIHTGGSAIFEPMDENTTLTTTSTAGGRGIALASGVGRSLLSQ